MTVQMKDFAVMIKDVKLDKYTQRPDVLRIKLWLHFHDMILKKEKQIENKQEVLDISVTVHDDERVM